MSVYGNIFIEQTNSLNNKKIDAKIKSIISKRKYLKMLSSSELSSWQKEHSTKNNRKLISVFELDYTKFAKYKKNMDVDDLLDSGKYKSMWDIIEFLSKDIDKDISAINNELSNYFNCNIYFLEGDNDICYYGIYIKAESDNDK